MPKQLSPWKVYLVAQTEVASTAESQPVEDPQTTRFTWTIENFTRFNGKKQYSEVFVVGSFKWRVLIFPKGNNVDHFSMYLDVADSANLPYGWSRYAQFSLAVVNQIQPKYTLRKDTQHQFNARESDWGFTSFMPLSELYDPNRGYLVNDTVVVEAEVAVRRMVDYWTYDSKKETGRCGTMHLHSRHSSYCTSLIISSCFKAVYHMPTTENDMPSGSIPLALQSLFYKLQYSDSSVATKELTKSFGWDTYDSFMQHDVQELNRVLCEKLEGKMKETVVEGTIEQLFEGHHINYIECINVDYKSNRKESFYDLQLDVKGCRDVYSSFDKYVEVERLEGDNKYHAENHGLQDAKKGVLFLDFPPVLQLQLKRFEYDYMRDTNVKVCSGDNLALCSAHVLVRPATPNDMSFGAQIHFTAIIVLELLHGGGLNELRYLSEHYINYEKMKFSYSVKKVFLSIINDRYEFPLQLDLDRDGGKYLAPDADRSTRNLYALHSVLVHSGGVHGGHYYAFIRPALSEQ
ncbi:Ubiquitin carboxyl-terminal hydrolase 12, partial [Dichanthelium oligosanthes]